MCVECRLQDDTEADIRTFVFWSFDSNYGSKRGRKILTDERSGGIHVSCIYLCGILSASITTNSYDLMTVIWDNDLFSALTLFFGLQAF